MTDIKRTKARYTRRHANWAVDYDYTKRLSKEEKDWLERFTDEYYRNDFRNDSPVHELDESREYSIKDGKTRKGTTKQSLMYTDYTRFRDITAHRGRNDQMKDLHSETYEDELIDYIDSTRPPKKKKPQELKIVSDKESNIMEVPNDKKRT